MDNWQATWDRVQQDPDYDLQDEFPLAGTEVDGYLVRDDVPNTDSMSASLTNYEELHSIREVSLVGWDNLDPYIAYCSADDIARTKELAAAIRDSGEINPLIIVLDPEGPYILEGGYRASAMWLLGAKAFPAVVVLGEDDL